MTQSQLVLAGGYGSPYSLKMRAVLRYRRIPFRWVLRNSRWDDLPKPPVPIIPVIAWPDDDGGYLDVMVDSSPQITRLEAEFGERSLTPDDPAVAFIDLLLEDVADEWVTKAMYHYRWTYDADIEKAGQLLPLGPSLQIPDEHHRAAHDAIIERQISRRTLVGSTAQNEPIIEASYLRLLTIIQAHLGSHDFLLGDRPGRADFSLFGQLSQLLGWDPTPMALGTLHAPRALEWVRRMDDLSWLEIDETGGWTDIGALPDTVAELLHEAGRTYAPFMLANAAALEVGAETMTCEIDGATYEQAPFGYQVKCLRWLREAYGELSDADRTRVDASLTGTGCEVLFA